MSRRGRKPKGIFCLEGDWAPSLRDRTTVEPILTLLHRSNHPPVSYIHRDIGTIEELQYYLGQWTRREYADYPILYLGFHGLEGALRLGGTGRTQKEVSLDWLEKELRGCCSRRVIHFGSCHTMSVHGNRLNTFLLRTKAVAVSGYEKDVEWMHSTAFEVYLLSEMQENVFRRDGLAALRRRVMTEARGLARRLRFRMVIHP